MGLLHGGELWVSQGSFYVMRQLQLPQKIVQCVEELSIVSSLQLEPIVSQLHISVTDD